MYLDARGPETIALLNDHTTLRTSIRGLDFGGSDFDALASVADGMSVQEAPSLSRIAASLSIRSRRRAWSYIPFQLRDRQFT